MIRKRIQQRYIWIVLGICLLLSGWQILTPSANNTSVLIINEFLASNGTGLTDEDGDYSDWIEIYNRGYTAVNLGGWALTDDPNQPAKWSFPDISLGSQEHLVVFASGKNCRATEPGTALHTNFKLRKQGEFLALHNTLEGRFMDVVAPSYPEQFRDISYGRHGDDLEYGYLTRPTPGAPNDVTTVRLGAVSPVEFSVERGFYETPFMVELTTATPGVTIRYTTDGSEPTAAHGAIYEKPILIDTTTFVRAAAFRPEFLSSKINTHTYAFLDEILKQSADPPGLPDTWGNHAIDFAGYQKGTPVRADYEMDPEIVNDPRYSDTLKDDLKSIPTLSLVTEVSNFYLYANPRKQGIDWERPVSVELIYPDRQQEGFQIDAGIRISGGAGRWEFIPKHSFRLLFKGQYGAARLNYPLFEDSPVESFDTLVLRSGADRSYAGHPEQNQRLTTYTRDAWLRTSQIEMSGLGSHGIFVHLYVNGLYWGLYNIVERPDESFMSSYFGGEEDEWSIMKQDGLRRGSGDRYRRLNELIGTDDVTDSEKYAAIESYLDITQFIDYVILNWYAGNEDWPHNNWYANVRNPSGQIKYFVWDGEDTWENGADIRLGRMDITGFKNTVRPLFEELIQNPDFKMEFADRMYKHLFNDGALTDDNSQARWLRINRQIDRAIVGESARWGDARYERPITHDDWLKAQNKVLAQMEGNAARLVTLAREVGYYPQIDPPGVSLAGGLVEAGFTLTMTLPSSCQDCIIYYTTNGSDPRLPVTGEVLPGAMTYSTPVALTTSTQLKARIFDPAPADTGQSWSALHETTFNVMEQDYELRITEVMYNPIGGSDYEFVELKNVGDNAVDLANISFEQGIRFTFAPNTPQLAAGEITVLVSNPVAFAERYPEVAISGAYEGYLSNKGEKIVLRDAEGLTLLDFEYNDENGWPVSADGRGDSLTLINASGDPNNPKNWRASDQLNGSPAMDE